MKRTAIYLRVSSDKQSTASQRPDMERWAAAYCDEPPLWFEDTSNQHADLRKRPGWDALCAAIEDGQVDRVAVWKIDRLGRRVGKLVELWEWLEGEGITFVSVTESLNSDSPLFGLVSTIMAGVAQYDNELRAARVRAGLAASSKVRRQPDVRKLRDDDEDFIAEKLRQHWTVRRLHREHFKGKCSYNLLQKTAKRLRDERGIEERPRIRYEFTDEDIELISRLANDGLSPRDIWQAHFKEKRANLNSVEREYKRLKDGGQVNYVPPIDFGQIGRCTKVTPSMIATIRNYLEANRSKTWIAAQVGLSRQYLHSVIKEYIEDPDLFIDVVEVEQEEELNQFSDVDFGVNLEDYVQK